MSGLNGSVGARVPTPAQVQAWLKNHIETPRGDIPAEFLNTYKEVVQ